MIGIYEPLYRPGQVLAEPAFLSLKVENTHPGWYEFRVLVDMYRTGVHRKQALTGMFSPRFKTKTGITGSQFIAFIEASPRADVYMINPRPELVYLTYNVWMQGEWSHPGILTRGQALLDACGIGWNLADTPRQGPDTMCYSNFWVGTEKFWNDYVGGVLNPIAEFLERYPESDAASAVLSDTRYFGGKATPFLPFIVERLFSTYLSRQRLFVRPYLLDPIASCVNEFERDTVAFLVDRVRRADSLGDFPHELKQWMMLLHRLRLRFVSAQYATHSHPRTAAVFSPEAVEDIRHTLARADIDPLQ